MFSRLFRRTFSLALPSLFALAAAAAEPADFILRNAKVATVDAKFTLAQAIAVRGDKILAVGSNADIAKLAGPNTRIVDAKGRLVVPGLMDSHTHPSGAERCTTWTGQRVSRHSRTISATASLSHDGGREAR